MKHLSDQQLMLIVQGGDYSPASEIYDRYSSRIYNFAYRFLRNAEAAEDAMQDVFMKMLKRANQYNGESKLSTWLFSITANHCVDFLRRVENKISKETEDVLFDLPASSDHSPDKRLEQQDAEKQVDELLGILTTDQREAILLSRYHGMSYAEIAKVVGCSEGAVKTRIFRGMEAMKRSLLANRNEENQCLNAVQ
jgi:RNA polymerase sigma-70 factor (family 1)